MKGTAKANGEKNQTEIEVGRIVEWKSKWFI